MRADGENLHTDTVAASPRLLSIREAAELLSVHLATLRRWEASGLIEAVRVGPRGHRRFRVEDVDALIEGARVRRAS